MDGRLFGVGRACHRFGFDRAQESKAACRRTPRRGLFAGACLMEPISLATYGLGDISVLSQGLQILGANPWQNVYYRRDGGARVSCEIVNDRIGTGPTAVQSDHAQHFI